VSGYVDVPDGWTRVSTSGPGPFVTNELIRAPDGTEHRWESRRHRKQSPARRRDATEADRAGSESVWWRPHRRDWWMAVLFAIGALCFTAGGVASQWEATPRRWIGVTFFVGSLFFTSAAYLQYSEAVNAERGLGPRKHPARWRPASWEPKRIDWLATVVQLIGTLLFNISTFAALNTNLTTRALGAGRIRLDRVPGRERARVRGGLPSLDQLPESHAVLEDRRAQPARLDRVRRVRGCFADRALIRRGGERTDRERRHLVRRPLLPDRSAAADARGRRRGARGRRRGAARRWRPVGTGGSRSPCATVGPDGAVVEEPLAVRLECAHAEAGCLEASTACQVLGFDAIPVSI